MAPLASRGAIGAPTARHSPLALGVLVSGEGTTMLSLAEAIALGGLEARIALVVADRPARASERARALGLSVLELPPRASDPSAWARRLDEGLREAGVELVVLAGFLSLLPPDWLARWRGRAINLHPSILPRFGGRGLYGDRVHAAVIAAGERESGASVHVVTEAIDAGPVLAQARVPVEAGDTPASLRARIGPVERELLIATVRRFAEGSLPLPYRSGRDPWPRPPELA